MNNKIKKIIYIIASMFLFFLFSMMIHSWIEMWHIQRVIELGETPQAYFGSNEFLSPLISIPLSLIFVIFGYLVGQNWWRIVYIEKRR